MIVLPGGLNESHPQETGEMALHQTIEHTEVKTEVKPTTTPYVVTWYTAGPESTGKTPDDPAYGITASGTKATEGRTAACPSSIPFGTRINIEGVGVRTCEDRGGAITQGHIDIYVESVSEARQHGRQTLEVDVLN